MSDWKYLRIRQSSYQNTSRKEKREGIPVRLSFDWTGKGTHMGCASPSYLTMGCVLPD